MSNVRPQMLHTNALYQLGRFVVMFQRIEGALTDLLVLLARADDEAVRILVNDLAFVQRVKTTTALFNRFIDLQLAPNAARKAAFAALATELIKLAERRNELVQVWSKCLAEKGFLMGVFFATYKQDGPPFGASEWELRERTKKLYQYLFWGRWRQSAPKALGKELFVYAQRRV